MIRMIAILLLLSGCAYNAQSQFSPPYESSALRSAERYVKRIIYLDWFEIQEVCKAGRVNGCVTPDGTVYMLTGMSNRSNYEVYYHEVAHLHEVHNLGVSWEDTRKHIGWRMQ